MALVSELAQAQLDAYNARDLDAFCRCYHEEVVVLDDREETLRGIEAFRARYATLMKISGEPGRCCSLGGSRAHQSSRISWSWRWLARCRASAQVFARVHEAVPSARRWRSQAQLGRTVVHPGGSPPWCATATTRNRPGRPVLICPIR